MIYIGNNLYVFYIYLVYLVEQAVEVPLHFNPDVF